MRKLVGFVVLVGVWRVVGAECLDGLHGDALSGSGGDCDRSACAVGGRGGEASGDEADREGELDDEADCVERFDDGAGARCEQGGE